MILLQRKLVSILGKRNSRGQDMTRQEFVDYITSEKWWPRRNYIFYRKETFRKKIDFIVGDCIRGGDEEAYKYISENDDGKTLLVTRRGRDFTELPLGCFEEFLKRRARTSQFLFSTNFIFGTILGAFIVWFLTHLKEIPVLLGFS